MNLTPPAGAQPQPEPRSDGGEPKGNGDAGGVVTGCITCLSDLALLAWLAIRHRVYPRRQ